MVTGRTLLSCFRRDQIRLLNSEAPGWQDRQGPVPEEALEVDPVVQQFQKGCKGRCGMRLAFRSESAGPWHRGPTGPNYLRTAQTRRHNRCRNCSLFWRRSHQSIHRNADYLSRHGQWRRCHEKCTDSNRPIAVAVPRHPSDSMQPAAALQATPSTRPEVRPGQPGATVQNMI